MKPQSFNDILAGIAFVAAIGAVTYLAVVTKSELVIGALVNLMGMAGAWYYRGRVETPPTPPRSPSV